jgi:hypothetical protein
LAAAGMFIILSTNPRVKTNGGCLNHWQCPQGVVLVPADVFTFLCFTVDMIYILPPIRIFFHEVGVNDDSFLHNLQEVIDFDARRSRSIAFVKSKKIIRKRMHVRGFARGRCALAWLTNKALCMHRSG